jgi:hypothetical protein
MTDSSAENGAAGLRRWLLQGTRSALLLRPDWRGLRGTPLMLLLAIAVDYSVAIGVQRLVIPGDATFYWRIFGYGLTSTCILAWVCWFVMPPPAHYRDARRYPGDAPTLFTMFFFQPLAIYLVVACIYVPALHLGLNLQAAHGWPAWLAAVAPTAWLGAAQIRLVGGSRDTARLRRVVASALTVTALGLGAFVFPQQFWYPTRPAPAPAAVSGDDEDKPFALTQEMMERQPQLLGAALDALKPQRKGVIDLYAITFAPYASQDVFMRESALVASVMAQRFDATGRTIQLVNNKATVTQLPWATPLNLQRTIARVGRRMDHNEDVLFIHLTSHGGANGKLAMDFDPIEMDSVTPQLLRKWLDDAGIRYRVISVSACYSGSWIAPLADDDTLVMTAADADHTSYGCGSKSPLTFFGRAMYDEQLRHTWSFEQAHAAARKVIDQREREAGKDNGYSNPQIRVGAGMRQRLARLEAQLAASAARK